MDAGETFDRHPLALDWYCRPNSRFARCGVVTRFCGVAASISPAGRLPWAQRGFPRSAPFRSGSARRASCIGRSGSAYPGRVSRDRENFVSFDRIARHYRLLETATFGTALQRARIYWIDNIPRPKRALLLGEGNGRFLCQLLRTYPKIDVDCLDQSAAMLALTRRRLNDSCRDCFDRVRLIHDDLRHWLPQYSYDLVVTHFFLDCFQSDEIKAVVDKIADAATPNARWLLADFTIPDSGTFGRVHAKCWLRTMYCFFGPLPQSGRLSL